MYIYTLPRENWDETNPDKQAILTLIKKHQKEVHRFRKLKRYYEGQHKILGRSGKQSWSVTMRRIFLIPPALILLATL